MVPISITTFIVYIMGLRMNVRRALFCLCESLFCDLLQSLSVLLHYKHRHPLYMLILAMWQCFC